MSRERQVKDPREQDHPVLIRDTERSQVRVYRDIDPDSDETRLLSWDSIRNLMSTQQRVTLILPTDEQTIIYLRTTTRAEVQQQEIFAALGIKPDPLGKRKTSVSCKKSVVPTDSD